MSNWDPEGPDLIVVQAMDFTAQWWITDHRGDAVPFENPAKLAARDATGQLLVELVSGDDPATGTVLTSPVSGVIQVVAPRTITVNWTPGRYSYELWATIIDADAASVFPNGQQVPVQSGVLNVIRRTAHMEGTP